MPAAALEGAGGRKQAAARQEAGAGLQVGWRCYTALRLVEDGLAACLGSVFVAFPQLHA